MQRVTSLVTSPRELLAALPPGPARATAGAPPPYYPLGSAQAELFALIAGLKPVVRSTLGMAHARATAAFYRKNHGLHAILVGDDPHARVRHGEARLYLGRDRARLLAAAAAERANDDHALGRLLGYPRCCVDAFLRVTQPRTTAAVLHATFGAHPGPGHPRLNCIDHHIFHYLPWLPCTPICPLSQRHADAVAAAIPALVPQLLPDRPGLDIPGFLRRIDRALGAHRLHIFPGVQLSLDGSITGDHITVDAAWSSADDRHPGAPSDPDAAAATARLLTQIAPGSALSVTHHDSTLHIDGRPLLRAPQLFLARFRALA